MPSAKRAEQRCAAAAARVATEDDRRPRRRRIGVDEARAVLGHDDGVRAALRRHVDRSAASIECDGDERVFASRRIERGHIGAARGFIDPLERRDGHRSRQILRFARCGRDAIERGDPAALRDKEKRAPARDEVRRGSIVDEP